MKKPGLDCPPTRRISPRLEALETRELLSGSVIAGRVYEDVNRNGVYDAGEPPIPNSTIELLRQNSAGQTVGLVSTTKTDSNGYYQFTHDDSTNGQAQTQTETLSFPQTLGNFQTSGTVPQFDPKLGTLTSVQITQSGTVIGQFKVENTGNSPASVTVVASGILSLAIPTSSGPTPLTVSPSASATAVLGAFDGTIDFTGPSGKDFGQIPANGSNTLTLTSSADLAAYTGTGTVSLQETTLSTSQITGPGNVVQSISTTTGADITVVYHYISNGYLAPGKYVVVQPNEPAGYADYLESSGGVVIPNTIGTDYIVVDTTNNPQSLQNNFGEIRVGSLSGFVYFDANHDGVRQGKEMGIAHVILTLTGTDNAGHPVSLITQSGSDGSYAFSNLQPGNYVIQETHPSQFRDGKDQIGTQGGTVGKDILYNIRLNPGVNGVENNFGEWARPGCKLKTLYSYFGLPTPASTTATIGPVLRENIPSLITKLTRHPRPAVIRSRTKR